MSKIAWATLLTVALLTSLILASSPELHEHWHHDSAQRSHQCAITIFEQQNISASNPSVLVIALPPAIVIASSLRHFVPSLEFEFHSSDSRGPPASSVSILG